jgi:hypothetical protein
MSKRIVRWRVWYADGRVVEAAWDEAPKSGVIQVMGFHEDGTSFVYTGQDIYFLVPYRHDDVILGMTNDWRSVLEMVPLAKFGSWTTVEHMEMVNAEARQLASEWSHGARV